MTGFRRHIALHRSLAAWLIALALALRVVVPTGYMADTQNGQVTVRLCDGAGPVPMQLAMPGMDHHKGDHGHDSVGQPCAFAGATIAGLAATATLIALDLPPLAPALVTRARPRAPPRLAQPRLRPPAQAPPALG